MKKSVLLLALLLPLFAIQAQEQADSENVLPNFNEIKLNGLFLVLGAFEATYERTLNEESGIGIFSFFADF